MTPNPHPASGNGVIERAIAETYVQSWDQHIGKDGAVAIMNTLKSAGLLKLSAADAAELEEYRNLKKYAASLGQRTYLELHAENEQLRKALPAPSPIDAAGMREACAKLCDDFTVAVILGGRHSDKTVEEIVREVLEIVARQIRALPTPAREIDREHLQTLDALVKSCEKEFTGECTADEPDDEPISEGRDKFGNKTVSPVTFGHIRRARIAIAALIGGRHV